MKKNSLLIALFITFSSLAYSQNSFQIIKPGDPNILNDSTITFYVGEYTEYVSTLWVINATAGSLGVYARQDSINMLAGNANAICWNGFCSADYVDVSPSYETLGSHDTAKGATTFNGDYTANGIGTSTVRYVFYNRANRNDSSWVLVKYITTTAGIASINDENISFSTPYPNPANSYVNFSYSLTNGVQSADLKIFNMLGKCIQTLPISPLKNKTVVDVQSMPSGIYICEVEANGSKPAYQKLIVSH